MKVIEKEAGQQPAEGVALARSAQIMEIQDTDYEINELGGQIKKGHRGLQCWSCGGFDHLQRDCKTGCDDDDDDQLDGPDQKVCHMHNTLVTESDVRSSMMGEIYRQLASAQLRGRLYKTGYRRTKASPKEVQMGTTGQNTAIVAGCGVSTVTTGTPGPLVPGTPQLKTPPRPVRLVTVPRAPVTMQMIAATSPSSLVPQTPIISMKCIQDKTPQVVTTIKQDPTSVTTTASAWKAAMAVKRRGRPKAQPVATCQVLDTIEELDEDSKVYPNLDFGKTESEAADLCEILEENSDLSIDEPLIDLATDQT